MDTTNHNKLQGLLGEAEALTTKMVEGGEANFMPLLHNVRNALTAVKSRLAYLAIMDEQEVQAVVLKKVQAVIALGEKAVRTAAFKAEIDLGENAKIGQLAEALVAKGFAPPAPTAGAATTAKSTAPAAPDESPAKGKSASDKLGTLS